MPAPSTHVYLDIEGTIIDSFSNPVYLVDNLNKIKSFLKEKDDSIYAVHFFSFAIHDDADIKLYEPILRDICVELDYEYSPRMIVRKEILFPIYKEKYGHGFSLEDFSDFGSHKDVGFSFFIQNVLKTYPSLCGCNFILFDDRVENMMTLMKNEKEKISSIMYVNINQIEKSWIG